MPREPGDRTPAPGRLRLVQRFVNSKDLEDGPELLPDPPALGAWLRDAGLLAADVEVEEEDHRRAIALREAIRSLVAAHAGARSDPAAPAVVNRAAGRAGLQPVLADPFSARLEPTAGGVDAALGRIVAAIHASIADGTWPRLKACERDNCRWAFYDRSRNRTRTWCAMSVCGNRAKARSYRARQR